MPDDPNPDGTEKEIGEIISRPTDEIDGHDFRVGRRDALKLLGSGAVAVGSLGSLPEVSQAAPSTQKLTPINGGSFAEFGLAIALDGAISLGGARNAETKNGEAAGAAYVFTREGDRWSEERTLIPSDGHESQQFGIATAVSGVVAVIGASGDDANGEAAGAAYVFTREGDTWRERKLTASDAAAGDMFGSSVALSEDGTTAIVGAVGAHVNGENGAGAAYVFTWDGDTWREDTKLTASDASAGDGFGVGFGVALDEEGTTAIVGAPLAKDESGIEGGAAYVYRRADGDWLEVEKLTAGSDADPKDQFGGSVGLDAGGTTAVVGAYNDTVSDTEGADEGTAYVFTHENGAWSREDRLWASDNHPDQVFGLPVAMSGDGDTTFIGATGHTQFGEDAGAAYVFIREDGSWSENERIHSSDISAGDDFGHDVAIDGATGLVGAPGDDNDNGTDAGAAYVFEELVPVDRPRIELNDVRPVQVVEDTFLRHSEGPDEPVTPDSPDLVAGRNTTVLFNLAGSRDLNLLSDDETVKFKVIRTFDEREPTTDSFELTKSTLIALANVATPETKVFDDLSDVLPVFEAEDDLIRITVEIVPDTDGDGERDIESDSERIDIGEGEAIEVRSIDSTDIGFIEVRDPDEFGFNFGGDKGRIKDDFDKLVTEAVDYIERVYPVDEVIPHTHPDLLDNKSLVTDGMLEDMTSARSALEDEFPDIDFDVTVAFVPEGYPTHHRKTGFSGLHFGDATTHPRASCIVRGDLRKEFSLGWYQTVVAQEPGHHFLPIPTYPDDLAMRVGEGIDNNHARTESPSDVFSPTPLWIDSTGVNLSDGTYQLKGTGLESIMSYNTDDFPSWNDVRAYQSMLTTGLEPVPAEEADSESNSAAVLLGVGRVIDDGDLAFTRIFTHDGRPMPSVNDGAVTLTVRNPNGSTIDKRMTSDQVGFDQVTRDDDHSEGVVEGVFTFAVPFPEETAAIEAERNGTITRLNPIERSLREAIARLPDAAFTRSPNGRRKALNNMLDELDEKMAAGEYQDALNLLEKDIRDKLEKWLQDEYETSALQPTKAELLARVDEMIVRLETLVEASSS